MAQCNVQSLLANAACFECLSPGIWDILELQLLCEIQNAGGGLSLQSQTLAINPDDRMYQVAHGLATTPVLTRVVLVCIGNDANTGYVVGQEIDIEGLCLTAGIPYLCPSVYCDATNIYCALPGTQLIGGENVYAICTASGVGPNGAHPTSFANFQLKFYYA